MVNRVIVRGAKRYRRFYEIISRVFGAKGSQFIRYEYVPWTLIAKSNVLDQLELICSDLSEEEVMKIESRDILGISSKRSQDLSLLFFVLAKMQNDEELMRLLNMGN